MSFHIGPEEEKQQRIVPSQTSMEDERQSIEKNDNEKLNNLLPTTIFNLKVVYSLFTMQLLSAAEQPRMDPFFHMGPPSE
jgi:hypothetical protein